MLTLAQERKELRSLSLADLWPRIVGQGGQARPSCLSQLPPESAFFTSLLIATALAGSSHSMIDQLFKESYTTDFAISIYKEKRKFCREKIRVIELSFLLIVEVKVKKT